MILFTILFKFVLPSALVVLLVSFICTWIIKKLRYSLMPADIGMKTAPLGCLTTVILYIPCLYVASYFTPLFLASVAAGLFVVYKMTILLFNKAKTWQEAHPYEENLSNPEYKTKPRFGFGIFFYIFTGVFTFPFIFFLLRMWITPFLCVHGHLNYSEPVEISLKNLSDIQTSVSLSEYPIGFIPGNESSFILIVDDKKGNKKRFPGFLTNCGSHYDVPIYHIPSKSDHGWLQFSSGGLISYLHLDSLQITDELPGELRKAPRTFLGIYERGEMDTNAKDPNMAEGDAK